MNYRSMAMRMRRVGVSIDLMRGTIISLTLIMVIPISL